LPWRVIVAGCRVPASRYGHATESWGGEKTGYGMNDVAEARKSTVQEIDRYSGNGRQQEDNSSTFEKFSYVQRATEWYHGSHPAVR